MQLILDNQFRWKQRTAERLPATRLGGTVKAIIVEPFNMAEQLTRRANPRQSGKFINGCDQEAGNRR